MAREWRTEGVLAACGLVGWLLVSCSGNSFSSKPSGEGGASGSTTGGGTGPTAGKGSAGSPAAAGTDNDGGKPAEGGSAGAASGRAGDTSTTGGTSPQSDGGEGGGSGEPTPSIPTDALLYWFKADAGVALETDGTVSSWADQSGNGHHARQTNTAYRPKLAETELLPRPVLAFDGENDLLELPEFTQAFDAGLSIFAVAGRNEENGCSAVIELSNGSEIDDIFLGNAGNNAVQFEIQNETQLAPNESWPLGEVRLLEVLQSADPIQATSELRVNGGVAGTMVMKHPVSILRTSNYIGRTLYTSCNPAFSGAIAEIIVYARKLGGNERISVEKYLMDKWQCCN